MPRFTNVVMRVVKHRFERVVEHGLGLHLPVENLARVEANGLPVHGQVLAPYRLILVPSDAARRGSDPRLDFRDDLARNLPSGTTIYEVLALDEPGEAVLRENGARKLEDLIPHASRIGALTTQSEFVASKYGDYRLFFKHGDVFLRQAPAHRSPAR